MNFLMYSHTWKFFVELGSLGSGGTKTVGCRTSNILINFRNRAKANEMVDFQKKNKKNAKIRSSQGVRRDRKLS